MTKPTILCADCGRPHAEHPTETPHIFVWQEIEMTDFSIWTAQPARLVFGVWDKSFLTLHPDGRIEIDDHVKPDEATQLFLDALAKAFPQWLHMLRVSQ